MKRYLLTFLAVFMAICAPAGERRHPCLLMTPEGVSEIRAARGSDAAFDASIDELLALAGKSLKDSVAVPVPRDGGGGYTHEKHKDNYYAMYYCGVAYQITGDERYARKVEELLDAYADLYPTLGYHPSKLSETPGRLFWQTLNDYVWLVHASIGYDCVYDFISPSEREKIERNLFRPYADFVIYGTPGNDANNKVFNKMHNHATWADAAVGMIGMAMGDETYVRKALYGSDMTGKHGGFMMQLDNLFSPDGYYTEGAYYERYAIWPFVLFANCINNAMPERKIFSYRDSILHKAVSTLLQMNYDGTFMKFNDALDKRLDCQELVFAVDIAYSAYRDPVLLGVAHRFQKRFIPTDAGFVTARDIDLGKEKCLKYRSSIFSDGPDGTKGGIAIIRSSRKGLNSAITLKATSHGLSHGHFDKLALAYYDNGNVVLTDYGSARFINVEAKHGGGYTPENESFAKQTIAHNTVTVDGRSHFDGSVKESSKHHSDIVASMFTDSVSVVSATEDAAAEGVRMRRTVIYDAAAGLQYPLIIDIFRLVSDREHTYDLPYYYGGNEVSLNFPYTRALDVMHAFGKENGYQHLWVEAEGTNPKPLSCFTFLEGDRFYSISTATNPSAEMRLVRIGAGDPDFDLVPEGGYVIRERAASHTFVSTIETHGTYDLRLEQTANSDPSVSSIELLEDNADRTVVRIVFIGGASRTYSVLNKTGRSNGILTIK